MAIVTVGSTALPDPSKMSVSVLDISNAERNANGLMTIDRVATKRKISIEWPALSPANMSTILGAITSIFFSVSYPDPLTGSVQTKTFYVGDRTAPMCYDRSGTILWEGLKMDFIEQ